MLWEVLIELVAKVLDSFGLQASWENPWQTNSKQIMILVKVTFLCSFWIPNLKSNEVAFSLAILIPKLNSSNVGKYCCCLSSITSIPTNVLADTSISSFEKVPSLNSMKNLTN
eukprot:NODE_492_length_6837_cov_0.395963.p8 type:complete len:113 gc:universal NODE_492_length_6837_cov_0.395963:5087-5425(+)